MNCNRLAFRSLALAVLLAMPMFLASASGVLAFGNLACGPDGRPMFRLDGTRSLLA